MKALPAVAILLVCGAACLCLAQTGGPDEEENLRYSVNWPSGLSLGEGAMVTRRLASPPGAREHSLVLDAAIPGITVRDEYTARATSSFCSIEFEKKSVHGKRKANERLVFDASRRVMVRTTGDGGGKSEVAIEDCAKDALTFLYFLRKEIAQGRIPPAQPVYFGAAYQVRLTYGGMQPLVIAGERVEADKLTAAVKGPASETTFEMWLARDAARTPLSIKVPFAMGTFSMDLIR